MARRALWTTPYLTLALVITSTQVVCCCGREPQLLIPQSLKELLNQDGAAACAVEIHALRDSMRQVVTDAGHLLAHTPRTPEEALLLHEAALLSSEFGGSGALPSLVSAMTLDVTQFAERRVGRASNGYVDSRFPCVAAIVDAGETAIDVVVRAQRSGLQDDKAGWTELAAYALLKIRERTLRRRLGTVDVARSEMKEEIVATLGLDIKAHEDLLGDERTRRRIDALLDWVRLIDLEAYEDPAAALGVDRRMVQASWVLKDVAFQEQQFRTD